MSPPHYHYHHLPPPPPPLFGSSGFLELTTMQLCNTISFCPLLQALFDLTYAELCKSNEFNIIGNFRLLHPRRQFKSHVFVIVRIINNLLQVGSNND